jgi:hypothetical protein
VLPPQGGFTWGIIGDQLICRKGGKTQAVVGFARVARTTEHHDEALQDLTDRINELVEGHPAARRRSDGRELSMILTPDGWMLAYTMNQHDRDWSAEHGTGEVLDLDSGDDDVIREKLGLA